MKSWMKIFIGLLAGISFGLVTGQQYQILIITGKVFIDLLKMLVGILIFSSVVTGICHINDPRKLGKIGLRTLFFFIATTLIAICIGIFFAFILLPGGGLDLPITSTLSTSVQGLHIGDFFLSMIPVNPIASFVNGNVLQVIVFAVLFALAIIVSGEKGKPIARVLESVNEVMNTLTQMIMSLAPIGVFALIASSIGEMGSRVILPLAKLLLCNYVACIIQVVCIFSAIIRFGAKIPVIHFFNGMKDAVILAFTTCSSAATLPVSIKCVRKELGIADDISGFVLSLGSTINMNGAAIGQVISCVFIAQAYGIELTWTKLSILSFTALVSAIGAAGVPGQGIVMLSIVLNAVGLPLEGIALVAGIDRMREMVSTVVNVLGDAVAATYVARKEEIASQKRFSSDSLAMSCT